MVKTTRQRHPTQIDVLFAEPLELVRAHCVPHVVQVSYKQMELSLFYNARLMETSQDSNSWVGKLNFR